MNDETLSLEMLPSFLTVFASFVAGGETEYDTEGS